MLEKKPFQFQREILVQVLAILLQLYTFTKKDLSPDRKPIFTVYLIAEVLLLYFYEIRTSALFPSGFLVE